MAQPIGRRAAMRKKVKILFESSMECSLLRHNCQVPGLQLKCLPWFQRSARQEIGTVAVTVGSRLFFAGEIQIIMQKFSLGVAPMPYFDGARQILIRARQSSPL